ncbi:MAG: tryptophan 7-halogenase, partial [Cyclobacteriaceae bacterium]|nr:tryptophan 7-halogenase [Cyclobacteriaceae bacterium]
MNKSADIAILGGGLAGMTLALQIKKSLPQLNVIVFEQRDKPAPERAFKVGESMVEVSSWYLGEVLGLKNYLLTNHLPKLGLRFFMNNGENIDFGSRPEYGLLNIPTAPKDLNHALPGVHFITYNIDRGKFENDLKQFCIDEGVEIIQGIKVKSISIGKPHRVILKSNSSEWELQANWVIDTTGRSGLLSRQLNLRIPQEHRVNATWFRVDGCINPDNFTEDKSFHNRTFSNIRWLSTNHLMGKGYWIWLIPLFGGATSVGIMTDPSQHSFKNTNTFEKAMKWLEDHEPSLAQAITNFSLYDIKVMKSEAYLCKQVLSNKRWSIIGESAFFSDALYSPGGDFIAIGNTLTTEMIKADNSGDNYRFSLMVKFGDQLMKGMYNHYSGLYKGSYQLMGRPGTMLLKVAWDTAVYFAYNV